MNDVEANKVVFVIIIFIIIGILFILSILTKAFVLNKLRNNSGNYNTIKILLMFAAVILIFFLIYWLFSSKISIRHSLMRAKGNSLERGEEQSS